MNDHSHSSEKESPVLGLDARATRTFDEDPLIRSIRAENQAIILASAVRRHPESYPNDARATAYLTQLAINAQLLPGPTFGAGGRHHPEPEDRFDETARPDR